MHKDNKRQVDLRHNNKLAFKSKAQKKGFKQAVIIVGDIYSSGLSGRIQS